MKVLISVLSIFVIGFVLVSSTPLFFDPSYKAPFPIKLYFEVAEKVPNKNLIVSPTSVTFSLALADLGSKGRTAEEFQDVLQPRGTTRAENAKFYGDIFSYVESQSQNDLDISIANRIYVDQKYNLKSEYITATSGFLKAGAENVDFTNTQAAAGKINSWVEEKTHNKIKDIVDENNIDESTALILVNAIYFKAPWQNPFETFATQKRDFFLSKTQKVQVDMMHKVGTFEVADWSHIGGTAIRIPYANSGIYMLIILPNEIDGLAAMEEKFKRANHAYMQTTPIAQHVDFSLPKFKFEFEISLVEVLKEMGLKTAFDNADFSDMIDGDLPLRISDVRHKAFIAVDEAGTEAAAATATGIVEMSLQLTPEPRKIHVDHPFMFAIRDQKTVYFAGHVVDF